MSFKDIKISVVKKTDISQDILYFVNQIALERYHSLPSSTPDFVLVAKVANQVRATVGISYQIGSLIDLYDLNESYLNHYCASINILKFSWFFCNKKGLFPYILLTALEFAVLIGGEFAILQMKDVIHRHLTKKGLCVGMFDQVKPNLSKIDSPSRGYYQDSMPVCLYYFDILKSLDKMSQLL